MYPALRAAMTTPGDGLGPVAYPAPVYHGRGPHGPVEADGEFELSVAQTLYTCNMFLRMVAGRALAWLEAHPGPAASIVSTTLGAEMVQLIEEPQKMVGRMVRGTKSVDAQSGGHSQVELSEALQGINWQSIERHYTSTLLLKFTRARGNADLTPERHDANEQSVAQLVRQWATPIAAPLGRVRYGRADMSIKPARNARVRAFQVRAAAVAPDERTAVRSFPPRVHNCAEGGAL